MSKIAKNGAKNGGSKQKSRAVQIGDAISDWTSKVFAHPYMQVGVILFCATWFAIGLQTDLLTAALSILAITLTQMVLNSQYDREADAHRRDVAMHAKLDELIAASRRAKNEFVGIEEREEEEIVQLKEEVKEAIEDSVEEAVEDGQPVDQAIDQAARKVKSERTPAEEARR
ncbi:low affinity iron permease family protein [Sphingomonas hankyongi]|uniref:Low affinity iron permease family protein n=1 Tax=Sphingomonas hankyongi TaxID=2908209 RepID=A0ABT0S0H0_9SPHN|nr:low affinity iron permease family protein [Sphingomonas hankyongi]MCL6729297.1 low affinity iron permease family protein [Sphingomonas hankyongi]